MLYTQQEAPLEEGYYRRGAGQPSCGRAGPTEGKRGDGLQGDLLSLVTEQTRV